jgi:4-amino-4-deoxy-L-arabinose transferase-like glycosyltransferase
MLPFVNKALQADSDMLVHASCMTALNPLAPPLGDYGRHMAAYNIHTGMPAGSLFYRCPHGPLLPLLLAPIASVAGNVEWPYHLALFPFSVAAVLGCYFLLLHLTTRPVAFLASVLMALAPVFVVNSHNIMWDIPVFAFMLWSLGLLISATRTKSILLIAISGVLAGCATITKMSAMPLLLCSVIFLIALRDKRLLAAWLLPAVTIPFAWAAHNYATYGVIQFLSTNHMNLLPADMRYKLERFVFYLGGVAAFPLGWWWIMVRQRENRLFFRISAIAGLLWATALFFVFHYSINLTLTCTVLGSAGIWAGLSTVYLLFRKQKLSLSAEERFLLCGFFLLYGCFLLVIPTAEPRFILPIAPFFVLLLASSAENLKKTEKRIFIIALLIGQALLSMALAHADSLVADADRKLPDILKAHGYTPANTGYYGRLQFDYYLWKAGYAMLGVDTARVKTLGYVVESHVPGDLKASSASLTHAPMTLVHTFANSYFPLRTCPPGCGLYGEDRLPYGLNLRLPLKSYNVYSVGSSEH